MLEIRNSRISYQNTHSYISADILIT